MSLKIYNGSRIEDLAAKLVEELKAERKAKGAFEFLKVAVANPNLGNWLKMKVLAKVPELGAGVELPFAEEVMVEVIAENLPDGVKLELKREHDYAIAIMDILRTDDREEFAPFRRYVTDGSDAPLPKCFTQRQARKAWQISYRLGQAVDNYESYGAIDTLKENKDKTETYKGEQSLADLILGPDGMMAKQGKASLRDMFDIVKAKPPKGTARKLRLFGFSSLTPLMKEVLEWIAKTHDVEEYCPGVFGDSDSVEDGSPLASLQSAVMGKANSQKREQDASVQIAGAPGIRREVELVYNAILGAVWERNENGKPVWKDGVTFSDFAVLVPDMKTYRPMIEAVFEGRGQIPYGLIDVTSDDYCSYLDGFLSLVELGRRGLSRRRLFDVLDNPCVQRAMGFDHDDVAKWREIVKSLGAYDGYDKGCNASGNFDWERALQRLRLGLVADKMFVDNKDMSELSLESSDKESAERFSEVVETLYRRMSSLKCGVAKCGDSGDAWEKSWAGKLHGIMDDFLAVDPESELDRGVRSRIVKTLNELAAIDGETDFELAAAAVEHAVAGSNCAKGGCIRSGVTIGGLRSLANVPFKQIFVVGMGEGMFPRRDERSTLDVRCEWPDERWTGLRRSDEDRGLFMSAVLSARDRLVVTYPNRNIMDDAKLYPSSLVREIESVMSEKVLAKPFQEFEGCTLVESDGLDESADSKFAGLGKPYSQSAWILAGRLAPKTLPEKTAPDSNNGSLADQKLSRRPNAKVLAEFVKDPFPAILRRRLGIAVEGYRDRTMEAESPLGLSNRTIEWDLQEKLVLDAVKGEGARNFDDAVAELREKGVIPSGFLGDHAVKQIRVLRENLVGLVQQGNIVDNDCKLLSGNAASADGLDVVCRKFDVGTETSPIAIPPDAVLEPLFEELLRIADSSNKYDEKKVHEIKVRVIDVPSGQVGECAWTLSTEAIDDYVKAVVGCYDEFLAKRYDAGYPCVTYDKFRKVQKTIDGEIRYGEILKSLEESDDGGGWGRGSFDSSSVVDDLVKDHKRNPYAGELETIYKKLFKLPMSGSFTVVSAQ